MAFPIKVCVVCSEEFELRPDKPGYANRCPACSAEEDAGSEERPAEESEVELNAHRRRAIRDLLYSKDN